MSKKSYVTVDEANELMNSSFLDVWYTLSDEQKIELIARAERMLAEIENRQAGN